MNRIKLLRKRAKITQMQVAEYTGIDRSTIALIEVDKRELTAMQAITLSNLFSVSIDFLLGLSDDGIRVILDGYPYEIVIDKDTFDLVAEDMEEHCLFLGKSFVLATRFGNDYLGGHKVVRYVSKGKKAGLLAKRELIRQKAKTLNDKKADEVLEVLLN